MYKRIKMFFPFFMAVLIAVGASNIDKIAKATVPGVNSIVSNASTGVMANSYVIGGPRLSNDGRVVAFNTAATNILSGGNNPGIFARNLISGAIVQVNVSSSGVVGDNTSGANLGTTFLTGISSTGRFVLFGASSTNLIDGQTMSGRQLYLRDTKTSTTTLVSKSIGGQVSNGSNTYSLGVSSDGRFVAFYTNATNLHSDASDGGPHLYMLDRSGNTLSILDRKTDGTVGVTGNDFPPSGGMSCDGSLIAFNYAGNLIVGQNSNHVNIYLLDRRGDDNRLSNLTGGFDRAALGASISCNGDYIGFKSLGDDIDQVIPVTEDYWGNVYRPYIYDRTTDIYHVAAVNTSGVSTNITACGTIANTAPCIDISDTGVGVFSTNDATLTGASGRQAYIRNIYTGTTEMVSRSGGGVAANQGVWTYGISADGSMVLYSSAATNLITGDGNNTTDAFTSLTGY